MIKIILMAYILLLTIGCKPPDRTYKHDIPESHVWFDSSVPLQPILAKDDRSIYNAFVIVVDQNDNEKIPVFPVERPRIGVANVYTEIRRNEVLVGFSSQENQLKIPVGIKIKKIYLFVCKLPDKSNWKLFEINPGDKSANIENFSIAKSIDVDLVNQFLDKAQKEYSRVSDKSP